MATTTSIIQLRRGAYADFDPQKMKPGEIAVITSGDPVATDGRAIYMAFAAGQVKRLSTTDDIYDVIYNQTEEIAQQIQDDVADDVQRAEDAADSIEASAQQIATNTADIADIKEDLRQKTGLSEEAKVALLDCFEHVAWIDEHGQTYYDNLYDALYPDTGLERITAVFTQGSLVVYPSTPLSDLKAYLTVTGYYKDGSSGRVTDYALTGTLTTGTSTITVTADEKTTTFDVIVSEPEPVVINITNADILYAFGYSGSTLRYGRPNEYSQYDQSLWNKYIYPNAKRAVYPDFDLRLDGGKTYKLEWDATELPSSYMAVDYFTEACINAIENGDYTTGISNYQFDTGWHENGSTLNIPETYNGSNVIGLRICFKGNSADTYSFTNNDISWAKITEI